MAENNFDLHFEYVSKLYLRLKGFLVTNLIIHSEVQGDSSSELDIIAVKLPFHTQNDRQINLPDFLGTTSESIQVLVADVKNVKNQDKVKFNKGLRRQRKSICKLIEWIGCFDTVNVGVITEIEELLNQHDCRSSNFTNYFLENKTGKYEIKFTFFCPQLNEWDGNGYKYIHGSEIMSFIWQCLNTQEKIDSCSRQYNLSGWMELAPYVKYFKQRSTVPTIEDFQSEYFGE